MPISNISPDDVMNPTGASSRLRALPYPSPFFDLAQTYFPVSIKELFQYCVYFYNTHCIVPAIVNKLASYPITELVFSTSEDKETQKKWKNLLVDELNLGFEMFQIGIDLGVYGNSFIGVYFPFKRYLICPSCESTMAFSSVDDLKIVGSKMDMVGTCTHCNKKASFSIKDKYIRNPKKIKLIRYDPMAIDIISDPISGHKTYIWEAPSTYREAIKEGKDLDLVERAPKIILDSIREDKKIKLSQKTMYHMKRPSISGQNTSWGFPLIMHSLKTLYYLQILKRAQEAIATQHIIPLWLLFPQGGGGGSSLPPAAVIGLSKWKTTIEEELAKWRKDPNHIPIVNFPVGFEQIGGEGRALLLGPEIQQEIQQVIASMAVPQEFVFGGMTWTGSSITLRMLENTFQSMRDGMQRLIRFLVNLFSKFLKYKQIDIYMSELKMADDIQRQNLAMNLEATGRISTTRLLSELNYDAKEEDELKKEEFPSKLTAFIRDNILQARAQGEASLVSLDYQIQATKQQMDAEQELMSSQAAVPPNGQPGAQQGGQQIDPQTGLPVDPQTGLPYDQSTGMLIDLATNTGIDAATGERYSLSTGEAVSDEEANASSMKATSLNPADSIGGPSSLQSAPLNQPVQPQAKTSAIKKGGIEEKRRDQRAALGQASSNMPKDIKSIVTSYAKDILSLDTVMQKRVLSKMEEEMPNLARLVKARMAEINTIEPSIKPPTADKYPMPAGVKPTTVKD